MDPLNVAPLGDVAHFAAGLQHDFLSCRTWSHRWDEATSNVEQPGDGRVYWSIECVTCGTVRTRILTSDGYIVGNTYRYPEGYRTGGIGRIDKSGLAIIRVESMKRAVR